MYGMRDVALELLLDAREPVCSDVVAPKTTGTRRGDEHLADPLCFSRLSSGKVRFAVNSLELRIPKLV